jgi:hypothetical protein
MFRVFVGFREQRVQLFREKLFRETRFAAFRERGGELTKSKDTEQQIRIVSGRFDRFRVVSRYTCFRQLEVHITGL